MSQQHTITDWLPMSQKEMTLHGWDELDVILVSGDAYVDHPSFGPAVIGRQLQSMGLRVGIIAQPNWRDDLRDFKKLGQPKLFFGVTAGCMDSMINHYTANKRLRSNDAYTPGGKSGFRPDYPSLVYTQKLKQLYPDTPVVLGGIEASLRRVTHYDYWQDRLRPSFLKESGADLLIYGMGEQPMKELVRMLDRGVPFETLKTIPQTAYLLASDKTIPKHKKWETLELASHESCLTDKLAYAKNFKHVEQESNKVNARRLTQRIGNHTIVINPPFPTMTEKEIDQSFDQPYTRQPHPKYKKRGTIPAYEMIRFSINMHRGCFGGCSFCTISAHQGKFIASRSGKSILSEVEQVTTMPDFRGNLSDLGGPSANMYKMEGINLEKCRKCVRPSCIFPKICDNLNTSHKPLLDIYRKVTNLPGIKKAFIGSGIRYDMLFGKPEEEKRHCHNQYIEQVIRHHVSGRLKVAPEHTSDDVLRLMRKPSFDLFRKFKQKFEKINTKAGLKQQLIPYFISSHPGSELPNMANLAEETAKLDYKLEQIQDFTPTPMTVATVIYYSGVHPYTLKPTFTARTKEEKLNQRRFFFWYKPENREWLQKTLKSLKLDNLSNFLLPGNRPKKEVPSHSQHPENRKPKQYTKKKALSQKGKKQKPGKHQKHNNQQSKKQNTQLQQTKKTRSKQFRKK